MILRALLAIVLGSATLALAGCGSENGASAPVSGTVTWKGEPVPEGDILFVPEAGGVPDPSKIRDGKFAVSVKPGNKIVQIFASRKTSEIDPVMGVKSEMYIPEQYNHKTVLKVDIPAAGIADLKYDLPLP